MINTTNFVTTSITERTEINIDLYREENYTPEYDPDLNPDEDCIHSAGSLYKETEDEKRNWFRVQINDEVLMLNYRNYIVTAHGIYVEKNGKMKTVCSHVILPIRIYRNLTTKFEGLVIAFRRDKKWKQVMLDKSKAYVSGGLSPLADNGVSVTDELGVYLQAIEDRNRSRLPVEVESSHFGWTDDSYSSFCPYSQDVHFSEAKKYQNTFNALNESRGSLDSWVELFKPFRNEDHIPARIALASSFASVLTQPCDKLPFIVDIWGSASGSGKTVALQAAASVWGKPQTGMGFVQNFDATPYATERLLEKYSHLPLCLDEVQTCQDRKDFDSLIYKLTQGIARIHAAHGGIREEIAWRNTIFVSGEQPIIRQNGKAGTLNRVIELECQAPIFYKAGPEMSEFCDKLHANYGTAGRAFVELLTNPKNMEKAQSLVTEYANTFSTMSASKQKDAAALILAADHLIADWIFHDDIKLTVEDIACYLKSEDEIDTNRRAYIRIMEWIQVHPSKLTEKCADDVYGHRVMSNGRPGYAFIPSMFAKMMNDIDFNLESFLSWAEYNDKIAISKDGSRTVVQKFNTPEGKKSMRCYVLYVDDSMLLEKPNLHVA